MAFCRCPTRSTVERMELHTSGVTVESERRLECLVVTGDIERTLAAEGVDDGLVLARTGHTSAALTTNEAEEHLLQDMLEAYTDLVPPGAWYFHDQLHIDTDTQRNAYAHILASFVRRPVLVPLIDGELQFGGYEDVLFIELDGPRQRTIDVTVLH